MISNYDITEPDSFIIKFKNISQSIFYENQKYENQMLTIINATVSHELRNPLNSIISLNYENDAHITTIDQIL
jgi:signal transduction histidine kinase